MANLPQHDRLPSVAATTAGYLVGFVGGGASFWAAVGTGPDVVPGARLGDALGLAGAAVIGNVLAPALCMGVFRLLARLSRGANPRGIGASVIAGVWFLCAPTLAFIEIIKGQQPSAPLSEIVESTALSILTTPCRAMEMWCPFGLVLASVVVWKAANRRARSKGATDAWARPPTA